MVYLYVALYTGTGRHLLMYNAPWHIRYAGTVLYPKKRYGIETANKVVYGTGTGTTDLRNDKTRSRYDFRTCTLVQKKKKGGFMKCIKFTYVKYRHCKYKTRPIRK
jgi:hypothetical protein